jgi:hypothetical protein
MQLRGYIAGVRFLLRSVSPRCLLCYPCIPVAVQLPLP